MFSDYKRKSKSLQAAHFICWLQITIADLTAREDHLTVETVFLVVGREDSGRADL